MGKTGKITPPANTAPAVEYQYRPRLVGAAHSFRLTEDALEWDLGRWQGRLPYRDVVSMRFSLRPSNLSFNRCLTEIRSKDGLKLTIASVSAKGMLVNEDRGPVYRAFVAELAARVRAAGAACGVHAGLPRWRWWPALAFALATFGAIVYVMVHAFATGANSLGILMAAFGGVFVWQVGMTLMRNRPRVSANREIPMDVLP